MRFAIVTGARDAKELWAYLPGNFAVLGGGPVKTYRDAVYVIGGSDSQGWTLDDYVIPRLGSGNIGAREISGKQAIGWLFGYANSYPVEELDEILEEAPPIAVHRPS